MTFSLLKRKPSDGGKDFPPEISATAFGFRVSIFYVGLFSIYGIHLPYLPVWLEAQDLSVHQIASVIALPFLLRLFFTPAYALFADSFGAPRIFIILLGFVGLIAIGLLTLNRTFISVLVLCSLFSVVTSSILPLAETIAIRGGHHLGLDYGRMRLWGSLSFALIGLIGGSLIEREGVNAALVLLIMTTLGTVMASFVLPLQHHGNWTSEGAQKNTSKRLSQEVRTLCRSRIFLFFLIAVSLTQASHALFYTFGVLHLHKCGFSGGTIGFIWTLGVLSEVLFFAFATQVLGIVTPLFLIYLGGAAAVFRWSIMSLNPPFLLLLFLQTLHALTFGATHLGAIRFISEAISPKVGATAQALHSSIAVGIAMGASTAISGTLYYEFSGRAFLWMAGLAVISLCVTTIIYIYWDRQKI